MLVLTALVVLSVIGMGAVFWLLKNDPEKDQSDNAPESKPESAQATTEPTAKSPIEPLAESPALSPPKSKPLSIFTSLKKKSADFDLKSKLPLGLLKGALSKIKLGKSKSDDAAPETMPMPNLKEDLVSENTDTGETVQDESTASNQQTPPVETSIEIIPPEAPEEKTTISKEEEENIGKEIELAGELSELKEKYDKLETLFSEKSTEHEKTKQSLNYELENRKEFNKVKDLLEKELRDSKDKTRSAQGELNNVQTENENQKKRSAELEEKSNKLEKDLLQKDDKIDDLVKKMQAFASPSTAAVPPESEEKKEESSAEKAPQEDPTPDDQPQNDLTQTDPPAENTQTEATSPPEGTLQNKDTSDEDLSSQNTTATENEDKSVALNKSSPPVPTEQETVQQNEEGEESKPPSTKDEPTQKGGFKLDLTIDQDLPDKSEKEDFLKLQPDVLSGESQETDSKEKSEDASQSPPKDVSDDQKPNL